MPLSRNLSPAIRSAKPTRRNHMNNLFVYIETEGRRVAEVSLELLTKGR